MSERFTSAERCAARLIEQLSGRVSIALPLGIGKPFQLANALYRKARENPEIRLSIHSALSLEAPRPRSDLEERLMNPLLARLYGEVPTLDYVQDLRRGTLPDNVRIEDFYFRPGAFLGVAHAQQNYLSINYTNVVAAVLDRRVNVIAQSVAPGIDPGTLSLSCNPDTTLDLVDAAHARGHKLVVVGEINPQLPFMPGDAVLAEEAFNLLLDLGESGYPPFPVPNQATSLTDHAIALRVAGLIRDGGTLQIGIGSLGDAIAYAIGLRRITQRAVSIAVGSPHSGRCPTGIRRSASGPLRRQRDVRRRVSTPSRARRSAQNRGRRRLSPCRFLPRLRAIL